MVRSVCPVCSRPYPPRLKVNGPVRQRVVEIVADHPDGIPIRELCNLVYSDDPNGGPLTAQRSINVIVHRANAQLAAQGYQIRARWRGRGSVYELIKIVGRAA
jgi:hypothetical protein